MFIAKTLFVLMSIICVLGLLSQFLWHIINQRNLTMAVLNYLRRKEFWFAPRFSDFFVKGYLRDRAVRIWYYRGIRRKASFEVGLTIHEIVIQLYTLGRFYLQLKPRSEWGKYFDRPHCWTLDPLFDYMFFHSSSPETFGGAVFGSRVKLCEGLSDQLVMEYPPTLMGNIPCGSWFTLEVKDDQVLLKGRSGRGHFIKSVDQLDELLNLLLDLADAIEETAEYYPHFGAEPIPQFNVER